jgi:hypothetical protein
LIMRDSRVHKMFLQIEFILISGEFRMEVGREKNKEPRASLKEVQSRTASLL